MKRMLVSWFPFAFLATVLALTAYATVQQVYRSSANDPQIQMAEDAAAKLASGAPLAAVVPAEIVGMAGSLAPYVIVFNENGAPVAASVRLNGRVPVPPPGVFAAARNVPEQRLTWQPIPGVRSAIVIRHYRGSSPGFVLAGRSLREVEQRIARLSGMVLTLWAGAIAFLLVYFGIAGWFGGRPT
jgi:hypothetical protein